MITVDSIGPVTQLRPKQRMMNVNPEFNFFVGLQLSTVQSVVGCLVEKVGKLEEGFGGPSLPRRADPPRKIQRRERQLRKSVFISFEHRAVCFFFVSRSR